MKKITIINGNPRPENKKFEKYLAQLSSLLVKKGHKVKTLSLAKMKLNHCIGCYFMLDKNAGHLHSQRQRPKNIEGIYQL